MSRLARLVCALSACAAVHTGAATAEGNRLVLACAVAPGTGTSAGPDQPTRFTIAPVRLDQDGFGKVDITGPDGQSHPGAAASFTGAFVWTADTVVNVLTVEETNAAGALHVLWLQLDGSGSETEDETPDTGADASDPVRTQLICEAT